MKKFSSLVVVAFLFAAVTLAAAQKNQNGQGRRGVNVEQRVTRMQRQLNLTPDQVSRIRTILQDENRRMQDLRSENRSTGRTANRDQMRQLREDTRRQIDSVLTSEQRQRFDHEKNQNRNRQGR